MKLKGPLMSNSASACFADILTYSKNHGRHSARKKTKPKVTRTPKQNGIRLMVGWLAKQWATLSPADWDTWDPLASETDVAAYHAYISYNMKRWRNWKPPTQRWPADETQPQPTTIKPADYPRWHAIKLQIYWHTDALTWGYAVHQNPHYAFVPDFGNLYRIQTNNVGVSEWPYDAPFDPPNTHVQIRPFGRTGVWGVNPGAIYVLILP